MRKALIVGIDYYEHLTPLYGCVNDAYNVKSVLDRNVDTTINFDINLMVASNQESAIKCSELKSNIKELFKDQNDIALFYFAGHGHLETFGGYLVTSDSEDGDDGLNLDYLLKIVNNSKAKNKIVILDSCHSGMMGETSVNTSEIANGVTILTASSKNQYASEENNSGVFTNLFVDALQGSASNLLGQVTPGSIYAHIDQSLSSWEQRPIFKTNVVNFVNLRNVNPPIILSDLRKIIELFNSKSYEYSLNPTYEPNRENTDLLDLPDPIEENVTNFRILQKLNRVNLVIPVEEEHMYYAAMNSKSCRLTSLGMHYWQLAKKGRI